MALALERLGAIAPRRGDWAKVVQFLEESVSRRGPRRRRSILYRALFSLANVLSRRGDPERAKSLRKSASGWRASFSALPRRTDSRAGAA